MNFDPSKYTRRNPYNHKNTLSLIDPVAFDALIRDHGTKIIHESATLCPCYRGRIESGQKNLNCGECENGYLLYDPIEIFVYMENTDLEKSFQQFGVWDTGTARLYSPSKREPEGGREGEEFYIGYFDRITVLDFLEVYSEVIERGSGQTDRLQFKALNVSLLRTERDTFTLDIDFRIDDDGNIKWVSKHQPTYNLDRGVGEVYTIRYLRNPVYRVTEIFHENRFVLSGVRSKYKVPKRLVQECLIKKDWLITKTASNGEDAGVQKG